MASRSALSAVISTGMVDRAKCSYIVLIAKAGYSELPGRDSGGEGWMRCHLILLISLALLTACHAETDRGAPANATATINAAVVSEASQAAEDEWIDDTAKLETVTFKAGAARHGSYSFVSTIKDTTFIPLDALPTVDRLPINLLFEGEPDPPTTAGGKVARSLGWAVLGEARIGPLTAVGIARGYKYAVGRFDFHVDGNVAIFEGAKVLAVLHRQASNHVGIGDLQSLEGGRVRVYTSLPIAPRGDLVLTGHRLRYGPLASVDTYCGGRAHVPNIYGQPIMRARAMLKAAGWRPRHVTFGGFENIGAQFARVGIHEVSRCVMDQVGQCDFSYASPVARLDLETGDGMFDDPERVTDDSDLAKKVFWYGVVCRAPSRGVRRAR
jgi:hypothetical protein